MVVRFNKDALIENQNNKDNPIGVEGDQSIAPGKVSEAEKIVSATKQKITEGSTPAVGVSASNSGRGHDPVPLEDGADNSFVPTAIEGPVEEEPAQIDNDESPEVVGSAGAPPVIELEQPPPPKNPPSDS